VAGILDSDRALQELYLQAGYCEVSRRLVLQRSVAGFRSLVSREQMQIRRSFQVRTIYDPPCADWWDASTGGSTERTRFVLQSRSGDAHRAAVTLWEMEPLSGHWGVHAMGIVELQVAESEPWDQMGTFLIGEAVRHVQPHGVKLLEVHVDSQQTRDLNLFRALGFEQVDGAAILRKDAS
jgi:hypothetical protein